MISDKKNEFMFIEPKNKKMEPDNLDYLTEFTSYLMSQLKPNGDYTKGWHSCACKKAHSDSQTFTVNINGNNYKTHNLILHYMKNHRSEVPEKFIAILDEAYQNHLSTEKLIAKKKNSL